MGKCAKFTNNILHDLLFGCIKFVRFPKGTRDEFDMIAASAIEIKELAWPCTNGIEDACGSARMNRCLVAKIVILIREGVVLLRR